MTEANGRYGLTNLPLGKMLLRETPPQRSQYRCTYPVGTCSAEVVVRLGTDDKPRTSGLCWGFSERRTLRRSAQLPAVRAAGSRFVCAPGWRAR